jgi:ATP-dependent protease ClpP protease subunit
MAKEILLYGGVNEYSAAQFITQMDAAIDEDVRIRVNTPGGSTSYNFGMIAKFSEHPKRKLVVVDGNAYSAGFYFCVNADDVECFDISDFMMHRAGLPDYIENNPDYFDDEAKAYLNRINSKFEKAVKNKLNLEALQSIMDSKPELKGAKVKDIFSLDYRINVFLTPAEAKKIGLVNKITTITPSKKEEIKAHMHLVAAQYIEPVAVEKTVSIEKTEVPTKQIIQMDLQTLKVSHPSVYAQAMAEGVAAEKERVEGWMTFNGIDAKAVEEGIASGKGITPKHMGEFTLKAAGKAIVTEAAAEAVPAVKLPEAGAASAASPTAEGKKKEADMTAFRAEMDAKIKEKLGVSA